MSEKQNKFYTYAYLREDRTPYYIGKGKGNRAYKKRKGEINLPKDKSRIIFLKQNIIEEEAFKHEKYMIAVFGRKDLGTGILRNKTDGGEGCSGWVSTDDIKRKQSESMKGKPSYWKGKKMPQEIIEKQKNTKRKNKSAEGENNPNSKIYRITFEDGRIEIVKSLQTWAVKNGYRPTSVRNLYNDNCLKKYKDIIKVEVYDKDGNLIVFNEENKLELKKQKTKERYQKNKEKLGEYQKEWRKNNKEKVYNEKAKENKKRYREKNRDKISEYQKEYRKKYREKNRDKLNEYQRQRYKNKKEQG